MPHTPGHTDGVSPNGENQTQASYKIAGTNQPYTGLTVNVGGFLYTTVGGGIEGDRQQVIPTGNGNTSQTQNNNPVTRLFSAPTSPRYRRSDNNRLIPIGANLHEHQDGTIMTEHGMGPNDNSVVVNAVQAGRTNGTRTQTRTQTSTGGMGGGTMGGGSGGGGGY